MEITLPSAAWQHHGHPAPQGLSPYSPAPCPGLAARHRLSSHKTSPRPSLVALRCPCDATVPPTCSERWGSAGAGAQLLEGRASRTQQGPAPCQLRAGQG